MILLATLMTILKWVVAAGWTLLFFYAVLRIGLAMSNSEIRCSRRNKRLPSDRW